MLPAASRRSTSDGMVTTPSVMTSSTNIAYVYGPGRIDLPVAVKPQSPYMSSHLYGAFLHRARVGDPDITFAYSVVEVA